VKSFVVFCLLLGAAAPLTAQAEIENNWVRVERVKRDRAIESFVAHGPSVLVYLTDVHLRMTDMMGVSNEINQQAGGVSYVAGGSQQVENLSGQPLEAVYIELRQQPSQAAPVLLDPVRLDPQHHIVLLENDRVRVIRTILEPHLKAPMHEHSHYVVVYQTELHTTMAMADGRNIDNVRRPGEIAWRDALKHATENVGDRTAMEIQVELK
jgi:quercetin dioxygenase-like cupin family protein